MQTDVQHLTPLIGIAVAAVIILLRNRQARPLNPDLMWIGPVILLALLAFGIWGVSMQFHPVFGPMVLAGLGATALAGAAIGWWRGKTIDIHRDPDSDRLMAQASPLGLVFIFVLFGLRYAFRGYLEGHEQQFGIPHGVTDIGFMLFAGGLLVVSRIEMWIRARGILQTGRDPAAA
ncbi:MAG: DUF1453 family protein [Caulobacteraceae bacterium]|nr:DUF1453 family protein [Caulobacteraceae bacterium]